MNYSSITDPKNENRNARIIFLICMIPGFLLQQATFGINDEMSYAINRVIFGRVVTIEVTQSRILENQRGRIKLEVFDREIAFSDKQTIPGDSKVNDSELEFVPLFADAGRITEDVVVALTDKKTHETEEVNLPIRYHIAVGFGKQLGFAFIFGTLISVPVLAIFSLVVRRRQRVAALQSKVESAEIKAENEPQKSRPAWILAQAKLEAYFDRNLQQVNQVFIVAVGVMCVGFAFILAGVLMSVHDSKITPAEIVAGGAGVITEFIGATFMVIYRSTMAQANQFTTILERINTVGMTVGVLDAIPESDLKNKTRADIIALLLRPEPSKVEESKAVRTD
jgi:hypothetical protein